MLYIYILIHSPVDLGPIESSEAFSADHGAALLKDGRVFLWGSNRYGQPHGVAKLELAYG